MAVEYAQKNNLKFVDAAKMLSGFSDATGNLKEPFDSELIDKKDFSLIQNIFASFSKFEDHGLDTEDKSVNAHNCRKSCMLSKMFLLHKLIAVANCDIGLNEEIKNLFVKYAKPYIELISVVTDLQIFIVYFNTE